MPQKERKKETIEQKIIRIIIGQSGEEIVTPDLDLRRDLNMDELDLLETVEAIEEEFNIILSDSDYDKHTIEDTNIRSLIDYCEKQCKTQYQTDSKEKNYPDQ